MRELFGFLIFISPFFLYYATKNLLKESAQNRLAITFRSNEKLSLSYLYIDIILASVILITLPFTYQHFVYFDTTLLQYEFWIVWMIWPITFAIYRVKATISRIEGLIFWVCTLVIFPWLYLLLAWMAD